MEKTRILCFGDSLTWGYHPETRDRIGEEARWTGVLQRLLGDSCRVIEEGQNGRTIATDDPAEGEKNGLRYIIPCLESQSPLDLMILMLGTNDLKHKFAYTAPDIAGEMERFLEKVQSYNHYHMGGRMKLLLMAPPITGAVGQGSWLAESFDFPNAARVSAALPELYRRLAERFGCAFLNAAAVAQTSPADGVHLSPEEQTKLGRAVYEKIMADGLLAKD